MNCALLMLSACLAAEPTFIVTNKTSAKTPETGFVVNNKTTAAPVVAAPKTFRNGGWHEGHQCPTCNRSQYVVDSGSVSGVHSHRCNKCGTTWSHSGTMRR